MPTFGSSFSLETSNGVSLGAYVPGYVGSQSYRCECNPETVVNRLEGRYIGGVGFGDITPSSTVSFITTSTPRLAEAL